MTGFRSDLLDRPVRADFNNTRLYTFLLYLFFSIFAYQLNILEWKIMAGIRLYRLYGSIYIFNYIQLMIFILYTTG